MGLHRWVEGMLAARRGDLSHPLQGGKTANQRAGDDALRLAQAARIKPANATVLVLAAQEALDRLQAERNRGLFLGESWSTYSTLHLIARAAQVEAALGAEMALRPLGRWVDVNTRDMVLLLLGHLVGWWRWAATLALEWQGIGGIVRCVGPRYKHGALDQEGNLRGGDVLAAWLAGIPSRPHPRLVDRLAKARSEGETSHEGVLSLLLDGPAGEYLRPRIPPVTGWCRGRLVDETWWGTEDGRLVVCSPRVTAIPDSHAPGRGLVTLPPGTLRWTGEDYVVDPDTPREGPRGVNACWLEVEEDGRLVYQVWHRGIQGVRAGAQLPPPEELLSLDRRSQAVVGPGTEPYPLPHVDEVEPDSDPSRPTPPPGGGDSADPDLDDWIDVSRQARALVIDALGMTKGRPELEAARRHLRWARREITAAIGSSGGNA